MKTIVIQLTSLARNRNVYMPILEKNHGITEERFQDAIYHEAHFGTKEGEGIFSKINPEKLNIVQATGLDTLNNAFTDSFARIQFKSALLKSITCIESDETVIIVLPPPTIVNGVTQSIRMPELFWFCNATFITEVGGTIVDSGVKPPSANGRYGETLSWKPTNK